MSTRKVSRRGENLLLGDRIEVVVQDRSDQMLLQLTSKAAEEKLKAHQVFLMSDQVRSSVDLLLR